ncbi:MAG: invasion associated locus B family protein [Methylovirgula sp.]
MLRTLLLAVSFAGLAAGQTLAQTNPSAKPPQSQPVGSEPETTTATYGVWTLRCTHRQAGGASLRFCEVEQGVAPQGQQNPIAQIGVGRLSPKDEMRLTVVLPTNITFSYAPKVTAQDKDPGVELTWERCVPGGCIADAVLKDDVLRTWHAIAADTGRVLFTNAAGRNIAIEFSFRGFGQAMDAFAKERS